MAHIGFAEVLSTLSSACLLFPKQCGHTGGVLTVRVKLTFLVGKFAVCYSTFMHL